MSKRPRIVCNTGPLIALGLLGFENVLAELFTPLVPKSVLEELQQGDKEYHLPASYEILDSTREDPLLQTLLDKGEAAVIQSAVDLEVSLVLMDEKRGRKMARRIYGLKTIGTARVLVEARKADIVPPLGGLFDKLHASSYWISDDIVRWALDSVGE